MDTGQGVVANLRLLLGSACRVLFVPHSIGKGPLLGHSDTGMNNRCVCVHMCMCAFVCVHMCMCVCTRVHSLPGLTRLHDKTSLLLVPLLCPLSPKTLKSQDSEDLAS